MWLIIGLLTMSSPVCLTLLEKYIREPMPKKRWTDMDGSECDEDVGEGKEQEEGEGEGEGVLNTLHAEFS